MSDLLKRPAWAALALGVAFAGAIRVQRREGIDQQPH
jgi:hypothetical protein